MEREKFRIPRSVQDAIPIRRIFADGIFQVGNQYSKTWSFTDINYAIASKEDKTSMFLDYSELLNALDSGASAKITIYNRRINKAEFERSVLLPDKADGLDEYRHEFNKMLTAQVTGTSNSIVRERYLTVSVVKRNADEARSYFARVGTDLVTHLAQLSSVAQELTLTERLHIFRDFFKAGEQAAAEFNIHEHAKRGQHFKDWFCPDSMEFAADHFKVDARYGRVLYLQDYASYIKDSFVSELCDLDRDLMLSIDILPVPTDEAARQLQSTLLGVETNVANWQRRQNANNNFTATIPYDMELQRKYNAIGLLNTDWGDYGHVNDPRLTIPGILYGAAFGWNAEPVEFDELNEAVSRLYYGDTTGQFAGLMAKLQDYEVFDWRNTVNWIECDEKTRAEILSEVDFTRIDDANRAVEKAKADILAAAVNLPAGKKQIVQVLCQTADIIVLWNRIGAWLNAGCPHGPEADAMAAALEDWLQRYRAQWRQVSKESSLSVLTNLICRYADLLRGRAYGTVEAPAGR
ncbi:hypothetical protein [Gemmiger formicilis]|uniref:hypothetical protein n=1 Tax=Gemmiger formicilis TaxID=745368 RepID=UPI00399ABF9C